MGLPAIVATEFVFDLFTLVTARLPEIMRVGKCLKSLNR